jgi:hypothetical protein
MGGEASIPVLLLYMWFPLAGMLACMYLIARFFARFSEKRTFSSGFLWVILLYGGAFVRYAGLGSEDTLTNVLFLLSGALTSTLSIRLLWLMLGYRRDTGERQ